MKKNKNKIFYLNCVVSIFLTLPLIFFSCSSDRLNEVSSSDIGLQSSDAFVEINELGFLHFSSIDALESYADEIVEEKDIFPQQQQNGLQKKVSKRVRKVPSAFDKSFLSVASWRERVLSTRTGLFKVSGNSSDMNNEDDIVLSEEEERLAEIDDLLQNDLLSYILDTSLRIQIEDTIFKITPYGTFAVERAKMNLLNSTIATFDTALIHMLPVGTTVVLENDVIFTNTFAQSNDESALVSEFDDNDDEMEDTSLPENLHRRASAQSQTSKPALHIYNKDGINYNVNSYTYKSNWWQKFWSQFLNTSGHLQHTKKRRAYMTISNLDYGFFKTCQIVLKFQKKSGGIWKMMVAGAPQMVIGINSLTLKGGGLKQPSKLPARILPPYYNVNKVKYPFSYSFGFSYSIKGWKPSYDDVSPKAPSCFTMSDIDVFGSIFAEGKWAGVRFYQN